MDDMVIKNMKKETLLEKTRKIPRRNLPRGRKVPVGEGIEVSFAWLNDEVTTGQINKCLGYSKDSGNVLYYIAIWLREAYRQGELKIKKEI